MAYSIALVPGDGIGPDVTAWATEVLDAVGDKYGHVFNYVELEAGGKAIDSTGEPLPTETLEAAKQCDALLLGAVGGPKWDTLPGHLRPERALLGLRSGLGVYANLRPAALLPQLKAACPLKDEVLIASNSEGRPDFDLLIVRELTGGLYFGERGRSADGNSAFDTETYSKTEIERVLRVGYAAAKLRRKKLCMVDKANVLESSRLWREVAKEIAKEYPDIETSYLYVDNCAMQLIRAPGQFDVIVTSNLFGDILSDEASVLTGSIGMLASASLAGAGGLPGGEPVMGIYEPIHGSAPDIAGQDIANPLAAILSAAMLLRYSFGLEKEAAAVEKAVNVILDQGLRTKDIAGRSGTGASEKIVGTAEMGKAVLKALENI
ncbi:3-isopropylmalate dehydrogenase [Treponema primitia ZAS-2]|uniref:3-isopropylmalate dehydrogenase n=1 Tax=Treponema primitia (strain ATCC BAA-887 / DSM 12427 / ZAS-2) TaxID=545694 RepID=F5YHU3_TREPZ|nr:3-isopropylmalate dehydrogenase [Treponema primitia]AEF83931.1 3-isopropylmalate dehydrogenase [Treponema primitia ZAS-2]